MNYIYDTVDFKRYLYYHCHCTNAGQSKEERRGKYKLARYFGKSSYDAQRLKDWNKNPFAKYFGYSSWKIMLGILDKTKND